MKLLQDGVIAMLAAIGLATLLWLAVSVFLRLRGRTTIYHTVAMIPSRGGANGLEHTIHALEQLRCDGGYFGAIVIVDCGLSAEGQQVAALLARQERDIFLCKREELPNFLQ